MTEKDSVREDSNVNYRGLFVMGVIFLGVGLAMMTISSGFMGLAAMGLIFMIIGFGQKDRWKSG
jgi:hypothetical protein